MTTYYYNLNLLASAYGAGSYDSATYGQATTGSGTSALTDTGIAVAGIVTVAAVVLLVALTVRVWKRPAKKAAGAADADRR